MPVSFEEAFKAVQALAKDFDANKAFFLSPAYQESEVQKDFIDKFLIALGWDVNHDRPLDPMPLIAIALQYGEPKASCHDNQRCTSTKAIRFGGMNRHESTGLN